MTQTEHFVLAKRYRLLHALGHGAMGTVWRAHDELLERDVAIKEIRFPAELDENERVVFYRRTLREARAPARVKHKSIIEVYDVVQEHARPWIVMELIEAPTLEQHIKQFGPMRVDEVAGIARQLVDALDEAHAAGVLHRDIKPSNVLLAPGRVVLTDFGLAVTNGSSTLTKAGTFVGSPAYVAPEVARGEKATPESDLWSLGATIYTAVEGRPPFDYENVMATLSAVLTDDPAPTQRAGELDSVIKGLLQRNPRRRLTHAKLTERLERAATPRRTAASVSAAPVMADYSRPAPMASSSSSPSLQSRRSGAHRARQSPATKFRPFMVAGLPLLGIAVVAVAVLAFSGDKEKESPASASTSSETAAQSVLMIKAVGGDCDVTILVGGAQGIVTKETVKDGQVGLFNKTPMDATVSDPDVCQVTINGERQIDKTSFTDIVKE